MTGIITIIVKMYINLTINNPQMYEEIFPTLLGLLLCPQSLVSRHLVSFQSLLNEGNYYYEIYYYAPNL